MRNDFKLMRQRYGWLTSATSSHMMYLFTPMHWLLHVAKLICHWGTKDDQHVVKLSRPTERRPMLEFEANVQSAPSP